MALNFGTSTAITITAGSLASNAARSCAAITPGTSNNTVKILLSINILTTTSAPSGNKRVSVYGYMSEDGTNFNGDSSIVDNGLGTDAALTALGAPSNLIWLDDIFLNQGANAVTIRKVIEVVRKFGCVPRKWGFVLHNDAGVALGATITANYTEIYYD
jgi:hypothetical protein